MGRKITITRENLTVDLLLDREYGVVGRSLLKTTMQTNPHLSGLDKILPLGTEVEIPDLPAAPPPKKLRTLFG